MLEAKGESMGKTRLYLKSMSTVLIEEEKVVDLSITVI